MDASDIGWIAGLIDGEGSIVLVRPSYIRKSDGRRAVCPRILVAVCDFLILEKYTKLLSELGINYGYVKQDKYIKSGSRWSRPNPVIHVYIASQESIVKLLEIVTPHLTLKRRNANLVLEFTKWRLENGKSLAFRSSKDGISKDLQDCEQSFWSRYLVECSGKARSHTRSLMEAVINHGTPIHWPD